MSNLSLDDDLVLDYLAESREHLATIETDLLSMEQAGADQRMIGQPSFPGCAPDSRELAPNSENASILLHAFDKRVLSARLRSRGQTLTFVRWFDPEEQFVPFVTFT